MKTLTPSAEHQRISPAQDICWLVEIEWPDQRRGYTTRPVEFNTLPCFPGLLDFQCQPVAPAATQGAPTRLAGENLSFRLALQPAGVDSLSALTDRFAVEGLRCRLRLLFRDAAFRLQDALTCFYGSITEMKFGAAHVEVEAVDFLRAAAQLTVGQLLRAEQYPALSAELEGVMAPIIFGRCEQVPLLPLRQVTQTKLSKWLHPGAGIIEVASLADFPESGTVQIGGELIDYTAIDEKALTIGTLETPVLRLGPDSHQAGNIVRLLPFEGFHFLVAGHPCHAIGNVRIDGEAVGDVNWEAAQEEIAGRTMQKIIMPRWPFRPSPQNPKSRMVLRGYDMESHWSIAANNTSLEPLEAFNADQVDLSAGVSNLHPLFSADFQPDFGNTADRYGEMLAARCVIAYSSSYPWQPGVAFTVRISKDSWSVEQDLVSPVQFGEPCHGVIDLTNQARMYADWGLLKDAPLHVEIQKSGSSSDELALHDIGWEIDYQPFAEESMLGEITADVEGQALEGQLVENPAEVIRVLLTDTALGALNPERVAEESFAQCAGELAAREYCFATRLDRTEALESLLASALFESCAALVVSGEKIAMRVEPLMPRDGNPVFIIDDECILEPEIAGELRPALAPNVDRLILRYAPRHAEREKGQWDGEWMEQLATDTQDATFYPLAMPCRWLAGNEVAARDLAMFRLSRLVKSSSLAQVLLPLQATHLERKDIVLLTQSFGRSRPVFTVVGGIELSAPQRLMLQAELAPRKHIIWRDGSRAFIARSTDHLELHVSIGGEWVATLDIRGHLRLRGQVVEGVLPPVPMAETFRYDEQSRRLLVGLIEGSAYAARFAFDEEGNLLLHGTLAEWQTIPPALMLHCGQEEDGLLRMGTGWSFPVACYEAASDTLRLAGQVSEMQS